MEKEKLKEQCIKLYLEGKNYVEIAKLTGWSRTFIAHLIENNKEIIKQKKKKKIKVYKRKDNGQCQIYIPSEFLRKIGISEDVNLEEYVDISIDEENKNIIISKHS